MAKLRRRCFAAIGLCLCLFGVQNAQAGIISTVEAPGVQTSSAINTTVIDFNSASLGYNGSLNYSLPGSLTANYQGTLFIESASQYGGAGGTGNYFSVQATDSVTLTLSAPQAYFGMWLSAADSANQMEFLNGNQEVGSFSATSSEFTSLPGSYLGNPNSQFLGDNGSEQYVFVNFYAQTTADMFNTIIFTNLPGPTEFESDNHTFSATLQAPLSVPEPSSLFLVGSAVLAGLVTWRIRR